MAPLLLSHHLLIGSVAFGNAFFLETLFEELPLPGRRR
jgi:hypothetical protein